MIPQVQFAKTIQAKFPRVKRVVQAMIPQVKLAKTIQAKIPMVVQDTIPRVNLVMQFTRVNAFRQAPSSG